MTLPKKLLCGHVRKFASVSSPSCPSNACEMSRRTNPSREGIPRPSHKPYEEDVIDSGVVPHDIDGLESTARGMTGFSSLQKIHRERLHAIEERMVKDEGNKERCSHLRQLLRRLHSGYARELRALIGFTTNPTKIIEPKHEKNVIAPLIAW